MCGKSSSIVIVKIGWISVRPLLFCSSIFFISVYFVLFSLFFFDFVLPRFVFEIHHIKLNLYFMVHSNVWKFEKIWLSGTLIIIRKLKVWRTNGHEDPYKPRLSSSGGIKNNCWCRYRLLKYIIWPPIWNLILQTNYCISSGGFFGGFPPFLYTPARRESGYIGILMSVRPSVTL